jgi:hypothetical protein
MNRVARSQVRRREQDLGSRDELSQHRCDNSRFRKARRRGKVSREVADRSATLQLARNTRDELDDEP